MANRDGRIIYTNIPLRCFENGVLICRHRHLDRHAPNRRMK